MSTRTVPMEVLCLGMGRTGTQSLSDALPLIGVGPVYHMRDVRKNSHTDAWQTLLSQKISSRPIGAEQFDSILGSYAATTDWPSTTFAADLIDAYPEAKLILTTRDEDAWLASMKITLFTTQNSSDLFGRIKEFHFGEQGEWEVNAKSAFREHNENVRKLAKKRGRGVLEYQVKEGWEPLCKFLGREVPVGTEFPRSDDWAQNGWKKVVNPSD